VGLRGAARELPVALRLPAGAFALALGLAFALAPDREAAGRPAAERLAAARAALTLRACPLREPALRLPADVRDRADFAAGLRRFELPDPFAICVTPGESTRRLPD
jgi:hypothetical protein